MKILTSFCKQSNNFSKNLLLVDLDSGKEEYLIGESGGITGITQDNDFFYAVSKDVDEGLFIIDKKTKKIIFNEKLVELLAPHSIAVKDDSIYIVSTGNDSVFKYAFDKEGRQVDLIGKEWSPEGSKGEIDTHHINSIFLYDNDIYVSAFGMKKSKKWSSAADGYIYNISKKIKKIEKIYHPHSVFIKNRNVYYCESSSRSVKINKTEVLKLKVGYTRGLSLNKDYLVLGTSSGRKRSHSTGLINNPADPGVLEEDCRVLLYRKDELLKEYELIKELNFLPRHTEIYDIIIVN
ncbi:MAG: hypothetical protein ACKUBY_00560 [Candidatus Moraniibacteriota bacterium]|jgi:hypothetical protein